MWEKKLVVAVALVGLLAGAAQAATYVIKQDGTGDYTSVLAAISGTSNSTGTILQFGDNGVYNEVTNAGSSMDFGSRQVYGMGLLPTLTGTDTGWGGNEEIVTVGQDGRLEGVKVVAGAWTKDVVLADSRGAVLKSNVVVMDGMEGYNAHGIRVTATYGNTGVVDGNAITFAGSASARSRPVALMASASPGTIELRNNVVDFSGTTNGQGAAGYATDNRSASALVNNTFLFDTAGGTTVGFDMSNTSNDHNDVLQNNLLLGAGVGIVVTDTGEAGTSTITDDNNMFFSVATRSQLLNGAILNTANNIDGVDPLLDAAYVPGLGSLAIDSGLNGAPYGTADFYGNARVENGVVDRGAVETTAAPPIPEPASAFLLAAGVGLVLRRRRNR